MMRVGVQRANASIIAALQAHADRCAFSILRDSELHLDERTAVKALHEGLQGMWQGAFDEGMGLRCQGDATGAVPGQTIGPANLTDSYGLNSEKE